MSEILNNPYIKNLKLEFREFCKDFYIKQIQDIFSIAGFNLNEENYISDGTRLGLIDDFYASADWSNEDTLAKLIKSIEYTLQLHYLKDETKNYRLFWLYGDK